MRESIKDGSDWKDVEAEGLTCVDTVPIVGVNDEDESLGVLVVMPPQGSDLVLPSDVPHGEADILVLDRLHVEA